MGKKTKPPAPPPEPPEPEGGKQWSDVMNSILDAVGRKFPDVQRRDVRMVNEPALLVDPSNVVDLAGFLKDNDIYSFNYCRSVTGLDKVDRFEVVYNLTRMPLPEEERGFTAETIAVVVVIGNREKPETQTLLDLWPSVDLQEREVYDLVGIVFSGHPDLRRVLLDEDFEGFPLRKDYPLIGKLADMEAIGAYLDEHQIKTMKEAEGLEFDPVKDVPPNYKR